MTPQLLSSSGIGPNKSLVNSPGVGHNLQDHPVVAMAFGLTEMLQAKSASMFELGKQWVDYEETVHELQEGAGEATNESSLKQQARRVGVLGTPGFSAGAFLTSPWATNASVPDIQLTVFPRVVEPHVVTNARNVSSHTNQSNEDEETASLWRRSSMLITVALLKPEARYRVLGHDSCRPNDKAVRMYPTSKARLPCICWKHNATIYLTDHDAERLAWGMEEVRRIVDRMDTNVTGEVYPLIPQSREELMEHVRKNHLPNSHWVGSTKMGRDDDPWAVVTPRLQVRGVEQLRIVDAGVIPRVPNGNTHSTVCVVARHAADLIYEDDLG